MKTTLTVATLLSSVLSVGCATNGKPEPSTPATVDVPMRDDPSVTHHNVSSEHDPIADPSLAPLTQAQPQPDGHATAAFTAATGYDVRGEAHFTEVPDGLKVHVEVTGATPGNKGIHVHQLANCTDIPNKSMGGHFSPEQHGHGLPMAAEHHLGDLGYIEVKEDGAGELSLVIPSANLNQDDTHSFLSRTIVLHESDDKGTGESADSGKPIACGIINE